MPVKNFPFRDIGGHGKPRPFLFVNYINPHSSLSLPAWALIDTGADNCVLPAEFAELLGHDLQAGDPTSIISANGSGIAYKHTMIIEIPDQNTGKALFSTQETMITFLDDLKQPLLGTDSFLCHFKLTVDYPIEQFSLEEIAYKKFENEWGTP